MKHFGTVKNGKLILKDRSKFDREIEAFEDHDIVIRIRKKRDARSMEQNSLWWVWCSILAFELGYTKDEMATILKYKFLQRTNVIDGKEIITIKSTTTLTKDEFNLLLNDVYYWSNDTLNIILPRE
jgi:hypothetical protein